MILYKQVFRKGKDRMGKDDMRIRILDAAAGLFNSRGMKFTMDELARDLGMSKKTIYTVFRDKMSLCDATVDYYFDSVLESERGILDDAAMPIPEKLVRALSVIPERYAHVDLRHLYVIKDKYPKIYRHILRRRDEEWAGAFALLEEGMKRGCFRRVSVPVFRTMFTAATEQFLQNDFLVTNDITYHSALAEVARIMVDGITVQKEAEENC